MADIKTRAVTRGSIKTLDRAASYMHHMKEATIRSKALDIYKRQEGENADTYAQGAVEHYAGDGTVYAARTGAEMILQNRHKSFERSNYPPSSEEQIRQAFREQGVKTIRSKQLKAKLADAEVLRNSEESRLAGRIRSASTLTSDELIQRNRVRIGNKRQLASKK